MCLLLEGSTVYLSLLSDRFLEYLLLMETITITMVRILRVRMRNAPVAPIIKTLLIIVDATVGDCSEQSESFIHRLPSSLVTDGLRIQ